MAEAGYKLLWVSGKDAHHDLAAWREDRRFEIEACTLSQAAPWLQQQSVDALVWQAGRYDDAICATVKGWKALQPQMQILVVLDRPPHTRALVALMHSGCQDVLDGAPHERIWEAFDALHERIGFVRARRLERLQLKQSMEYAGLVGGSAQMLQVYEQIRHAASLSSPVLLHGETGTGKGLVAHAIHALSAREGKSFVTVDCGCLAPTLIESELYGVTRGAFTGATTDRIGLVQTAQSGTLFLDEIGELPLEMQPKLLRLLEEGEVRRLGSAHSTPVDIRVISATSQDLEALIAEQRFRVELYYRLNVIHIALPPLRERRQDIPLLANHFASRHLFRGEPIALTENALEVLTQYFWPGNVRELKNCIEAAVPTLTRNSIHMHNLPRRVTEALAATSAPQTETLNLRDLEKQAIRRALLLTHNEKAKAAKLLGIGKTTLYRKLKQLEEGPEGESSPSPEQAYLM